MRPAAFSGFSDPGNARIVCRTGTSEPDVALSGLVTRQFLQTSLGEPSSAGDDEDITIPVSARFFLHTGTLTADRVLTFDMTEAVAGDSVLVTRTGGGAFNLNVGTGPLKALATDTWGLFVFDGSSIYLAAYGAL
jgi:hypothetical protein